MRQAQGVSLGGLFALAVALGGCKGAQADSEAKTQETRVHVDTTLVTESPVPRLLALTGVLSSNERTDLAANAAGRVVKTFVERGDHVAQGAVLAQLDARSAVLSQAEAKANATSASEQLKNLQADCARYQNLLAKGAITQQEYDKQATSCQTSAASEEAARVRAAEAAQTLTDSAIRAPFAGVIAERFVHVGDYVHADTRVVTLLVDDPLRLQLTVPEANIGSVHTGLNVSFESISVPGKTFTATVKFLGREIRETTRDLVVEAVTDNKDHVLLPGMFVTAHLPIGEKTEAVVPAKSIVHVEQNDTVFIVVDKKLQQRTVQLGPKVGELVAIDDGVKKGDMVVVSPPAGVVDGTLTE
jgi:membrane fusion protein, multidrug efflux system